jgi:hypothetical protein
VVEDDEENGGYDYGYTYDAFLEDKKNANEEPSGDGGDGGDGDGTFCSDAVDPLVCNSTWTIADCSRISSGTNVNKTCPVMCGLCTPNDLASGGSKKGSAGVIVGVIIVIVLLVGVGGAVMYRKHRKEKRFNTLMTPRYRTKTTGVVNTNYEHRPAHPAHVDVGGGGGGGMAMPNPAFDASIMGADMYEEPCGEQPQLYDGDEGGGRRRSDTVSGQRGRLDSVTVTSGTTGVMFVVPIAPNVAEYEPKDAAHAAAFEESAQEAYEMPEAAPDDSAQLYLQPSGGDEYLMPSGGDEYLMPSGTYQKVDGQGGVTSYNGNDYQEGVPGDEMYEPLEDGYDKPVGEHDPSMGLYLEPTSTGAQHGRNITGSNACTVMAGASEGPIGDYEPMDDGNSSLNKPQPAVSEEVYEPMDEGRPMAATLPARVRKADYSSYTVAPGGDATYYEPMDGNGEEVYEPMDDSAGISTCSRPAPGGALCNNAAVSGSQFCAGHLCSTAGCNAGKSSREKTCPAHTGVGTGALYGPTKSARSASARGGTTKCTRPSPSGRACTHAAVSGTQFCEGHSCSTPGCQAGKSSRETTCPAHTGVDDGPPPPLPAKGRPASVYNGFDNGDMDV